MFMCNYNGNCMHMQTKVHFFTFMGRPIIAKVINLSFKYQVKLEKDNVSDTSNNRKINFN